MNPRAPLLLCILLGAAVPALAVQCTLTTSGLHFGALSSQTAGKATARGTLLLTCRGRIGESIRYHLQLTQGNGSYRQRVMQSDANHLAYNLYLDAGRTRIWGDGSESTGELSGTVRLPAPVYSWLFPVYARTQSQAAASARPYADTVLVELTY